MSKQYIFQVERFNGRTSKTDPMTLQEAVEYFEYTLETGAAYSQERGNKKINLNPKTIDSLITNLNNASRNASKNGSGSLYSYCNVRAAA